VCSSPARNGSTLSISKRDPPSMARGAVLTSAFFLAGRSEASDPSLSGRREGGGVPVSETVSFTVSLSFLRPLSMRDRMPFVGSVFVTDSLESKLFDDISSPSSPLLLLRARSKYSSAHLSNSASTRNCGKAGKKVFFW